jgi:hypothetical protein
MTRHSPVTGRVEGHRHALPRGHRGRAADASDEYHTFELYLRRRASHDSLVSVNLVKEYFGTPASTIAPIANHTISQEARTVLFNDHTCARARKCLAQCYFGPAPSCTAARLKAYHITSMRIKEVAMATCNFTREAWSKAPRLERSGCQVSR